MEEESGSVKMRQKWFGSANKINSESSPSSREPISGPLMHLSMSFWAKLKEPDSSLLSTRLTESSRPVLQTWEQANDNPFSESSPTSLRRAKIKRDWKILPDNLDCKPEEWEVSTLQWTTKEQPIFHQAPDLESKSPTLLKNYIRDLLVFTLFSKLGILIAEPEI